MTAETVGVQGPITVRPMTPDDHGFVADNIWGPNERKQDVTVVDLLAYLREPRVKIYLAQDNSGIIGMGIVEHEEQQSDQRISAEVKALLPVKGFEGKEVSAHILGYLVDIYKKDPGFKSLRSMVESNDEQANALFLDKRFKFKKIGPVTIQGKIVNKYTYTF